MTGFDDRMAALGERFRSRCASSSASLRDFLERGEREAVAALAHNVAGNAGLFGFAELGSDAEALESAARSQDVSWADVRMRGEAFLRSLDDTAGTTARA